MSVFKAKHVVSEIEGVRCSVVETGVGAERVKFLKNLLEVNHFNVKILPDNKEGETETFTIGVDNLSFNPVISVYERNLKTADGHLVTPAYWEQKTTICDSRYWIIRK